MERIQKILAAAGLGSRRECEELIEQGRVTIDGEIAELGSKADIDTQKIYCDGEAIRPPKKSHYLFYKPKGVLCTNEQRRDSVTFLKFFKTVSLRLFCVGRLDQDSEGIILVTNDGNFSQQIAHPKYNVVKIYQAQVKGIIDQATIEQASKGVWTSDGKVVPHNLRILFTKARDRTSIVEISLKEGKNREIRRFFAKIGYPVRRLIRVNIGFLDATDLEPGRYRKLTDEEVEKLLSRKYKEPDQSSALARAFVTSPHQLTGSSKVRGSRREKSITKSKESKGRSGNRRSEKSPTKKPYKAKFAKTPGKKSKKAFGGGEFKDYSQGQSFSKANNPRSGEFRERDSFEEKPFSKKGNNSRKENFRRNNEERDSFGEKSFSKKGSFGEKSFSKKGYPKSGNSRKSGGFQERDSFGEKSFSKKGYPKSGNFRKNSERDSFEEKPFSKKGNNSRKGNFRKNSERDSLGEKSFSKGYSKSGNFRKNSERDSFEEKPFYKKGNNSRKGNFRKNSERDSFGEKSFSKKSNSSRKSHSGNDYPEKKSFSQSNNFSRDRSAKKGKDYGDVGDNLDYKRFDNKPFKKNSSHRDKNSKKSFSDNPNKGRSSYSQKPYFRDSSQSNSSKPNHGKKHGGSKKHSGKKRNF